MARPLHPYCLDISIYIMAQPCSVQPLQLLYYGSRKTNKALFPFFVYLSDPFSEYTFWLETKILVPNPTHRHIVEPRLLRPLFLSASNHRVTRHWNL
jgi:hypothetical protein